MARVLTALQPTGILHLGNYFGAIEPFVTLQNNNNENILFAVDYHAITVQQDPKMLKNNIMFAIATYIAAGVDPKKTILFQQSRVKQHSELCWILNCIASMGELERMTQYKDKANKKNTSTTVGLFDYPVLMAADILLYDTEIVPVGADQKQHVELARDLAQRFNNKFGKTFTVPKVEIRKEGSRIMGLDDPKYKMSKSAPSPKNYISLMDDKKTVQKKISSATTDSNREIKYDKSRKGLANLMTIYSLITGQSYREIERIYNNKGYQEFKYDLTKHTNNFLSPLQDKIKINLENKSNIVKVLDKNAKKAEKIAEEKMKIVRKQLGITI